MVPDKGSSKGTKRTEALWALVGAMLPALMFGGVLWGISGFLAIAFAAFSVILVVLVAIGLYL